MFRSTLDFAITLHVVHGAFNRTHVCRLAGAWYILRKKKYLVQLLVYYKEIIIEIELPDLF